MTDQLIATAAIPALYVADEDDMMHLNLFVARVELLAEDAELTSSDRVNKALALWKLGDCELSIVATIFHVNGLLMRREFNWISDEIEAAEMELGTITRATLLELRGS